MLTVGPYNLCLPGGFFCNSNVWCNAEQMFPCCPAAAVPQGSVSCFYTLLFRLLKASLPGITGRLQALLLSFIMPYYIVGSDLVSHTFPFLSSHFSLFSARSLSLWADMMSCECLCNGKSSMCEWLPLPFIRFLCDYSVRCSLWLRYLQYLK